MSRNQNRVAANTEVATQNPTPPIPPAPPPAAAEPEAPPSPFNFIVPTELVDLPSQGQYYPSGHPLCGASTIEIRHMTAKEEDILTSTTLLKKGLALDKMLQSIIVNNTIKVGDLLVGDKNALLIASRIYGYGADYVTNVTCPECDDVFETQFDLTEIKNLEPQQIAAATPTENQTFIVTLPKSGFSVEFRLLTARDEAAIASGKSSGSMALLKLITVSVNDQQDKFYVERALQTLPILDVTLLKRTYAAIMPDVDMRQEISCEHCGNSSVLEVPLNAGFFWPQL